MEPISTNQKHLGWFHLELKKRKIVENQRDVLFHQSKLVRDCGIVSNGCDEFHRTDVDVFFCFEMVLTTRNLLVEPYSDYQSELHDIIQNLHDEGLGYRKIAQWLNERGYTTLRGKRFFNTHVFSIPKKKRLRDERLNREFEVEYRNFSLEFMERKLINSE